VWLALVLYLGGEPNEIAVDIQPKTVALTRGDDEPLSIEIEIENKSVDAVIISALGLDSKLMDSLEVVDLFVAGNSELRKPKERNYPVYGNWTEYKIDQTIPEKKKLYLTLQIKARPDAEFGTYSGDLTIWVEDQVLGVSLSRATRSTITITVAAGQAG
jgi:hypothetical protein